MSVSDEEITRLYRVRKTCFEMLRDRGYEVEDSEINMTRKEFIDKHNGSIRREDLTFMKSKPDKRDPIFVFFPEDMKIGVKIIKNYVIRMENENVRRAIVVVRIDMTPSAKACQTEIAGRFQVEVFKEAELLLNIRYHDLVPEHILLTNAEKKALLDKYTVKDAQLPQILQTDPIARYYGLRKGQVVKILRPIETGTSEKDKDDFESNKRDRNEEICYVSYRIVR
ncbi:DNA-directed RNA polymerases II and IV subunit 5A-like [Bidens hawaiensis]|uniref:DNA-directed RNA polymerases II and IV subunit 5A-like n=1 Tax=Bidens hawaiensis TaxID=980011 RepID=UPI004049AD35